jgi:arylsulfatase A-like enzyme/Flp pilus assembly protein TadD
MVGCSKSPLSVPPQRPTHVLLITVDTLRADAIGAYGDKGGATPHLDRLAAAGVRFDRAHAHNVVTLPSHANILSGRYPIDHGVRDNAGFRFPASLDTAATILKSRGYRTGAFISAFPLDSRFGLARGFDVYDDGFVDATPRPAFLEQERKGSETVGRAVKWRQAQGSEPTFSWVHVYEPHFPYRPPEPFAARFRSDPYEGEVAAVDAELAPLIDPILDAGPDARTLVIVTADHGESLGEHGEATHGIFAYEATLRVPLIVYAPQLLGPRVVSSLARHVDVLPTILDAVGVDIPTDLRGQSLLPVARGEPDKIEVDSYFEALSASLNRGWAPLTGIMRGTLKYIDLPVPELYDEAADPGDTHNVIDARTDQRDALRAARMQFQRRTGASVEETADTRERLRSLGYASGGATPRASFTAADDPKNLISLDTHLQNIVGKYMNGDVEGALIDARAFARAHPAMPLAFMELGHLERESGNMDAAIGAMRRALRLRPGSADTAALLGAYLTQANKAQDAVAVLQPFAAQSDPELEVLVALAIAQARTGQPDAALETLSRAREQAPNNAMVLVDVGTVNMMAGRRDAARRAFEEAVAQQPDTARAYSSLAALDAEAGRTDAALAGWRRAVALDPAEYGPLFATGVSLARAGRAADARAYLDLITSSAPADRYGPQIAQARAWLSRQR